MLPAYWPLLVGAVAVLICGVLLSVKATVIAERFAQMVHRAPEPAASLLLVRKRPRTVSGTAAYLRDIYRVVGIGWVLFGVIGLIAIFYGTPPH